ncbi:Hypothetical predicted protein [Paramuricea clavata]|uniref:Uncharacterized protein n=1 Tax=Paramuricea clavata TaxID=317549 RepID=A0A7D9J784_PARCT|nr:Hypothetical predicted protein [Paramuricea clavata]
MVRVPQPDKPKIWVTVLDLKKNSISCINITMLTQDFPNIRHMDLRENPINCGVVKSISTRALHVISDCYSFNMTSTNSPITGGMQSIKLHPSDKPWINTNIKKLIAKRQRAWLTGHPSAYSFYRNKTTKLCSNPKKWWKNIKALSGFAKPSLPSCLYHDGEFKRGADLADLIAESFSKVSDDIPALSFTKLPITTIPNEFILSPQQVEYELSNIKVHKSVGPDAIPNWLLKFCVSFLSSPICSIFNSSIAQGAFPNTWKCADVIPISKVPNPKSADDDLRPISLTSVLSKILERFIYLWLLSSIHPHIVPYQYGNIKNCSTTHQLIHLIHHWLVETDKPENLIRSCMIDFSKAFDRIDHNILLMKLTNLDVPPILINWCANFLQDRQLRVKLGEIRSNWKQIKAGVPQ